MKLLFGSLLVIMLALTGCGQQGAEPESEQAAADTAAESAEGAVPQADEAWEAMVAQLQDVETDGEKVPIIKAFVKENPNHERAAYALSGMIYYLGDDQAALKEGLRFSREVLPSVTEADIRREMQLELVGLYGRLGDEASLAAAADELASAKPLGYPEHDSITEAALEAGAWELAATHAEAGLALATPEAFRADYPERNFTDEDVADAVRRRTAASYAGKGWALANLGRTDEALAAFAAGSGSVKHNYVGIPDSPLFSYWGRTLAEAGKNEKAMDMLVADAILGGDEEAMDALNGAYVAARGEAGFEDYLLQNRRRLAKKIDDFTLNNYQGEPLTFSQLKGQVVLLSFWFPS